MTSSRPSAHVVNFGLAHAVSLVDERTAYQLADAAVVADIEAEGSRVGDAHDRRYDIRPMLDPREHSPEVVDMARLGLAYAIWRNLVEVDRLDMHVLRIRGPHEQTAEGDEDERA